MIVESSVLRWNWQVTKLGGKSPKETETPKQHKLQHKPVIKMLRLLKETSQTLTIYFMCDARTDN